jgi:amino acid adenylation domain-containing protein
VDEDQSVEGYRISPVQRYLTRADHDPSRGGGWVQATVRLDDRTVAGDLDRALRRVWNRHEALRTRLVHRDGLAELVQVVDDPLPRVRIVDRGNADPDEFLDRVRAAEQQRTDLAGHGVSIVRVDLAGSPEALVITGSAAVVDEQSLRIVVAELSGADAAAADDPIQYPDVAIWYHEVLADESRAPARARWAAAVRAETSSALSAVLLTGQVEGSWTRTSRRLDGAVRAEVDDFARDVGRRPAEVCVAAWLALQAQILGEHRTVAGVVVPARGPAELVDAVGPYARELPLLVEADLTTVTFRGFVATAMDAWDRASAQAEDLDPVTRTGPVPVSASIDQSHDGPGSSDSSSLRIDGRGTAAVHLRFGDDGVVLDHDAARLPCSAADDLLDRILTAVGRLVAGPDVAVAQVSFLLPGEDVAGAALVGPPPATIDATLPELVAARADLTPTAVAVDDGVRSLTYAQLSARVHALAADLRSAGLSRGAFAVLSMPRCCELVVGILAVLETGAAYVPVDVDQPASRLEVMIADVGAAVLLRVGDGPISEAGRPDVRGARVLHVDASTGIGAAPPTSHRPVPAVDVDATAYVMYTSGSTGAPNGVPVTHRSLLTYLQWAARAYHLDEGGGSIVHSPIGFDLTVTGLLGPLVVGGRVRLVRDVGVRALIDTILAEPDVTLVKVTPSQLPALIAGVGGGELTRRVRTLVCGGEQLAAEAVSVLRDTSMRIVNEYGPTETVVGCVAHEIAPGDRPTGPVPIGRPIAGATIHLVGADGRPVPRGAVGEIVVAGAGVGAGYHDRPAETAARFVADPVVDGRRAYRTGDRARLTADGTLLYVGRQDDQLKVLGIRVEPGEVEAVLRAHPAVRDAAVVGLAPVERAAPTRLAAQVVLVDGASVTGHDLVEHCRNSLPAALVPVVVAAVRQLPVTAHGKLDRRTVEQHLLHALPTADHVEPRNHVESVLSRAIAAVLGRPGTGIDDNYFAIGGDSIRSVMIASRAAAEGVDVAVADLHRWPTIRALAAEISGRPDAVVAARTAPFGLIDDRDRALMPPDVEDAFPLNLLQEGMIFHRDFAAKSAVYHAIASVRLHAPLDLEVLREVIRQLVARHPMLRTSFDQRTFSRPLQLVHTTFRDPLGFQDLRDVAPRDHQRHIDEWVHSEKLRGFDLDEHPLIRFMVQRLDDDTFQFTYGFHHEIIDGWSEALMITELFTHYFSEIYGERWVSPVPASSMRDAVALELEALRRPEHLEFWTEYLDGASLMRLPRIESPVGADTGARDIVRIPVEVGSGLSDRLKTLATTLSMPLKNVLLAAHMAVMNHYHGQPDTLSYTVTNGRPEDVDGSSAIGLFVNSLALRLTMPGGRWSDLVRATLDAERRTMPHRRLPMAELKRHQGSEPLAETLFFFTDYHVFRALDRWRDRGVRHEASELYGESTFPFCAIFRTNRETGEIEVRIEYDGLQFPADLMDRVAQCYATVLTRMADDPDERYDVRSLLGPDERRAVVEGVNGPGHALGDGRLVHQLIRQQAERTPDRVALADASTRVTYAALVEEVDRVAARLRAEGAGPEQIVGVVADAGIDAIVGMLGILGSGAAYLPLDRSQPAGRLAGIVEVARPLLVLVTDVDDLVDLPVRRLPRSAWTAGGPPHRPVRDGASPESAAYLIFTSGSTGAPKGVVVTHRNVVSSTLARARVYPEAPDQFLLLSSPAVDSSVAGIFWTLSGGGTIHVPAPGAHRDPAELTATIRTRGITHTLAVPALLSALVQRTAAGWAESLRHVIAAGDVAPRALQDDLAAAAPAAALHNEYGPTEATVWSNHFSGAAPGRRTALPIGHAVPGARTYALDSRLHPAPLGVPAELHIGGAGVARGYVASPAHTASAFLPDPYAEEPGRRMYRTGDLVRLAPGTGFEFLGRTDHQVKIRGYRVELAEVEAVLERHPAVRRAIALARPDSTGEARLHSYVVPVSGTSVDVPSVLRHVRASLPASAVPVDVTVIDALPLTRNGKVDRDALPPPTAQGPRTTEWVAPATPTEELVAAIWSRILGVPRVGRDDDFFDLGGESLRAMNVINGVNSAFGLELSVRALFDNPALRSFAEVVDDARDVAASALSIGCGSTAVAVATE